jgi:diacylglycerol kinase family enzyme
MTRAYVIGRRRKGRTNGRVIREVERALRAGGWSTGSALVKSKRDLRRVAASKAKAGYDVVVAVGGDGAVMQVATAIAGTGVALGIIPTGTGNLLAGNLDIPNKASRAAQVVLTGQRRRVDMGHLTIDGKERDFTVACGVGFDADVMDATAPAQKLRWGKLAYLGNAIAKTDTIRNVPHEITLDGEVTTMDASQVFVANFGRMLPLVKPRRPIHPDDGRLDVIAVRASGPLPGLLASWEVLRQKGLGASDGGHVFRARAREVKIDTRPRRLVETDGSVVGRTPLVARVMPGSLTVMVPRR